MIANKWRKERVCVGMGCTHKAGTQTQWDT